MKTFESASEKKAGNTYPNNIDDVYKILEKPYPAGSPEFEEALKRAAEWRKKHQEDMEKGICKFEYSSLESYISSSFVEDLSDVESEAPATERELVRKYSRRIEKILTAIGINISIFKSGSKYNITSGVKDFLNYSYYMYKTKGLDITKYSMEELVDFKSLLIAALYSIGVPEETAMAAVGKIEKNTGCLPVTSYQEPKEFTTEALDYLRADWNSYLTESEWLQFATELDFIYRSEWLPKLKTRAINLLKLYVGQLGKTFPDDEDFIGFPSSLRESSSEKHE